MRYLNVYIGKRIIMIVYDFVRYYFMIGKFSDIINNNMSE